MIAVEFNYENKIILSCVYNPPSSVNSQNLTKFQNIVVVPEPNQRACGDFNVNSMRSSKTRTQICRLMLGNEIFGMNTK